MRITIALALYVFLTPVIYAGRPDVANASTEEWRRIYDAGLQASQHQSYEDAISLFLKSWETAHDDLERGASATDLAQTHRRLGHSKEAALWYLRAKEAWSGVPTERLLTAAITVNLADLDRNSGDYIGAEAVLREGLTAAAPQTEARAIVLNGLADLLREQGRIAEAAPLFEESAAVPCLSSQYKASALIGLADIDKQNGRWDSSIARWNAALELARKDGDTVSEAIELRGLADTWLDAGSPSRAEPLLRRSLRFMESGISVPKEQVASVHAGLGQLYRSQNKLSLAEEELSRALEIDRGALGETHPQVAWLLEMLSEIYSARGEFELAGEYATRASLIMANSFGENSMPVAAALTNRALIEQRAAHLDAAVKDYERALTIARTHPDHSSIHGAIVERYASLLKTMHRGKEAKAAAVEARSFRLQ